MSSASEQARFLDRFEALRRRARIVSLAVVLFTAIIAATALQVGLAVADFHWELSSASRTVVWLFLIVAVSIVTLAVTWRTFARWSRPTTAVELEDRFPGLGQRIRTAVQFTSENDNEIRRDGVAPSLVTALEEETSARTAPLELDVIVPTRRLAFMAVLAVIAVVAIFGSAARNPEWKTALERSFLAEKPYTTVSVKPQSLRVDEGERVTLTATVHGRPREEVVLQTRPVGKDTWTEQTLIAEEAKPSTYQAKLAKVSEPMEYRIVAGPAASEIYRIDVRYPLALQSVTVDIESPAYTQLPTKTIADGNITALRGSRATFRIALDRPPHSAEAVIQRVGALADGEEREFRLPFQIEGSTLTMQLNLHSDLRWSIVAVSQDGTELPENAFRVRVREDQPPRVSFDAPGDALAVHTLAEVLMRIRTSDDYGLSRAGIVFQVNNNEEYTLLEKDFAEVAAAADEVEQTGVLTPRTRSSLERVLPLEHFALTQKDCVIYYAFAEDNFPDGPHRVETDLRFIDVRPFKQTFRIREPGNGMGGGGGFTSLEELIRRQRYVLNRTIQLDKRTERWGDRELSTVERLKNSQQEIADLTRELADNLIERGADDVDSLFQAEAAMLNAVDSLSVAKFDTATLQEKDAQQALVEARNRLEILLRQAQNNSSLRQALGMINRGIQQKLRRNRNRENEATAESLVQRLQQLASNQGQMSGQLAGLSQQMQAGGTGAQPMGNTPMGDAPEDETPMEQNNPASSQPTVRELEEQQFDAVAEAQEIQQELTAMENVTDLARQRMQSAVETTDQVAGMLARGDTNEAAKQSAAAAEQFGELARQVAALLAEEAPERVAMARDMTADLAERQRRLAGQLTEGRQTDEPAAGELPEELARKSRNRAETLGDVLQAISQSQRIEDGDAADRVAELVAERRVNESLNDVRQLPDMVAQPDRSEPQTVVEIEDTADRLEVAARELDQVYRSLITPRIEQLRQIEQNAVGLLQQMERLETSEAIGGWQQDLEELLEEMEQAQSGGAIREELNEMAQSGALPGREQWLRNSQSGYFGPPNAYNSRIPLLVEEIQQQIQELVLTDLFADRDEATPPQYEHLVERYLKVLAAESAK